MPVFIPTCCQIEFGYGEGDNTPASLKDIVSRVPPQMWALQLALVLFRECLLDSTDAGSHFKHYLATLPRSYGGLPMLLNDSEIDELQVPSVVQDVASRKQFLSFFCDTELAGLERAVGVSMSGTAHRDNVALIDWAVSTCATRGVLIRNADNTYLNEPSSGGHLSSLLPVIDLCNHGNSPNMRVHTAGNGTSLQARRDIEVGEPLLIQYGARLPNRRLFIDYGFVPTENRHDNILFGIPELQTALACAKLRTPSVFTPPPSGLLGVDELQKLQDWMLVHIGQVQEMASPDSDLLVSLKYNGTFERSAWALARVMCADTLRLACDVSTSGGPFTVQNRLVERRAQLLLHELCGIELGRLPTSAAHDESQLASLLNTTCGIPHPFEPGSVSVRGAEARESLIAAIRFRLSYKKIALQGQYENAERGGYLGLQAVSGNEEE